mgnify:CR=1 FL=1
MLWKVVRAENKHIDTARRFYWTQSVVAEAMTGSLQRTVANVFNEKESAIICALKATFWLVQEDLAITKFESLVKRDGVSRHWKFES